MKKMNILLVAFTLALSAITPMASFAVDDDTEPSTEPTTSGRVISDENPESQDTTLSLTKTPHYTITIPADTTELKENDEFKLSVTTFLKFGDNLDISVSSKNEWKLKDTVRTNNNAPISYTMNNGEKDLEEQTEKILTVPYTNKTDSVTLTVTEVANATYAGTYEDVLTFTAETIPNGAENSQSAT